MSDMFMVVTTIEKRIVCIRAYKHMESRALGGVDKGRILSVEEYCTQIKTVHINPPIKGNL